MTKQTDFSKVLEEGIRAVLENKASTTAEKLKAIEIGTKFVKVSPEKETNTPGSFFSKKD